MEFNEEKAKEVIQKFGLDNSTVGVWKTRNEIPDRYFDEEFHPEKLKKVDVESINSLINVMCLDEVNLSEMFRKYPNTYQNIKDLKRKKSRLTEEEAGLIKKKIILLKNEVRQLIERRNYLGLLNHPEIRYHTVLKQLCTEEERKHIAYCRSKNKLSESNYVNDRIIKSYQIFENKLNLQLFARPFG
eukprot:TRINITY_DN27980_c0_g1_i1.p1 TRINITY_DN27980_c0_g1~~TRINITY_DN27980_c0_g1_i1.p1  ORF type:complete len:187 (-),score=17.50 TRINITY_DN27980_c0_g1_i1:264-824(-)